MFISDEEKRQIMAELARGNPEMRLCCKNLVRTENPDCRSSDYATTPNI
jgi:hypothetical protein